MQDLKTRMLISGMSWESQETVALKNIYVQIQSFYQHTELNLDDLGKEEILGELKALSSKIEDLIGYTYNEMNRLIERDSKKGVSNNSESIQNIIDQRDLFYATAKRYEIEIEKKVCVGCESDKTYYCNTCMEDMSGQHSHNS